MTANLSDFVQHEISRALARHSTMKAAEITAFDPDNHRIKAMLHPDEIETGWFSVNTAGTGNGWGVVIGPKVGDQISVGFFDGNIENPHHLGRLHSDKERPPVVQSGEILLKHETGAIIKIDQNGNMTFDVGSHGITLNGNVDVNGGYLKHHGHDVGFTHEHIDSQPGTGLTGVPQ